MTDPLHPDAAEQYENGYWDGIEDTLEIVLAYDQTVEALRDLSTRWPNQYTAALATVDRHPNHTALLDDIANPEDDQ